MDTAYHVAVITRAYGQSAQLDKLVAEVQQLEQQLAEHQGKLLSIQTSIRFIPMCRQPGNQRERAQRAQRRHISVDYLCVLGVFCGYDNKSVSADPPVSKLTAGEFLSAS